MYIFYNGKFNSDNIPLFPENTYGLVWDGDSIDECSGNMGQYLKYNTSHKISFYIAAGIPVIIWKKSAMSSFIYSNNLGILIDSINDIKMEFLNLNYQSYLKSVHEMKEKITNGYFINNAISQL